MNPNNALRHLLWKDLRQVQPALYGCLVILAMLQIIYTTIGLLNNRPMDMIHFMFVMALVAPTLSAIACTGVLIGQERQTRTWNWSSSLPISWHWAMLSKFLVWLGTSIGMTSALLLIHALCYRIALAAGYDSILDGWVDRNYVAMSLFISLEAFVFFGIASLLWSDTLQSIVITGIGLVIGNILLLGASVGINEWIGQEMIARDSLLTFGIIASIALGLGGIGQAIAFRWRWGAGQLASLGVFTWTTSVSPSNGLSRKMWQAYSIMHARPKSEFRALFAHAGQSSLWLRAMIVVAGLAIPIQLVGFRIFNGGEAFTTITVIASALLGVTVFSGDQTLGRFRFFSDRGCHWFTFMLGHTVPAMMGLITLVIGQLVLFNVLRINGSGDVPLFVFATAFCVGMTCSLCISSGLLAVLTSLLSIFLMAVFFDGASSFWVTWTSQTGLLEWCFMLSTLILVGAVMFQSRAWMKWERTPSIAILIRSLVACIGIPILLCYSLGFLTVPAVPWLGVSIGKVTIPSVPLQSFELTMSNFRPHLTGLKLISIENDFRRVFNMKFGTEDKDGEVAQWLTRMDSALVDVGGELISPQSTDYTFIEWTNLQQTVVSTAMLATIATQARNADVAVRAWTINRNLLELMSHDSYVAALGMTARLSTLCFWDLLDASDFAYLREHAELSQLQPVPVSDDHWLDALKKRRTFEREYLSRKPGTGANGSEFTFQWQYTPRLFELPVQFYPPIRWRIERGMAIRLLEDLKAINSKKAVNYSNPFDFSQGTFAAPDPLVNQVYWLRVLENSVHEKSSDPILTR